MASVYHPPELTALHRQALLELARQAIAEYLKTRRVPKHQTGDPALLQPSGAFVTLWRRGELRGCIGHIDADMPLCRAVQQMAVAAAVNDPRFPPVEEEELGDIEAEINILSPLAPVASADEIEVGKHGLMITKGIYRGLLLPEVAVERKWDRYEFLEAVCWKAGLPPGAWREGATLQTFTSVIIKQNLKSES